MPLPNFLQSALWSYDLSKMDKNRYKKMIISQVLNYGDKQAKAWVLANYSSQDIKNSLLRPQRGIWFRDKLREWLAKLDIILDPLEFEVAIRDLNPRPKLMQAYFQRKGLLKNDFTPIKLAYYEDIAAMKIVAIIQRAKQRDFFDLYYLIKKMGLTKIISATYKKYPWYEENNQIILKALTFFEEADQDEEIKRITILDKALNWERVKKEITIEVKRFMAS